MADTASGDVAAAAAAIPDSVVDLDFNIDDFDVFDFGDLAADEFCEAYSAFVANADAKRVGGGGGWLAGLSLSGGGGEGSLEGSPDSVVTDDGPLAGEEAMSAVVAELERYLMEDGDDVEEVFCADGDRVEQHICVDDFFGDLLGGSDFSGIVTAASAGALHDGVEDNDDGDVLAAREDEPASRKRARRKIRGTTMTPWWGELEVTRRHLARIQVPAPWPPVAAVLLCCM